MCTDPQAWYLDGAPGLWTFLFIYSKIPELLDTVFLVLQNKPVIFLHWFHHSTVLLYCWHAYHNMIGPGIWFAGANFLVHSVMYTYYCLMTSKKTAWIARPLAVIITTMQILQMVVGAFVTVASMRWLGEGCFTDAANVKLGLAMYTSYFALFSVLFYKKYLGKQPQKRPSSSASSSGPQVGEGGSAVEGHRLCGVEVQDGAGFFHSSSKKDKGGKLE